MTPEKLITRIRSVLGGGTGNFEIQGLAIEYADVVTKLRDRADQCVALIRAGNDYAALQVAESFPPLLDTAAKLAFAESHNWHALCRERNIPCPPPLEQKEFALVSGLYGRKINETHPLYRDYRQAVREHNELRALTVLGSIIRINGDDQNARHEFLRLSKKVREDYLARLDEHLAKGENDDAFALADKLENLHLPTLANAPGLVRIRAMRQEAAAAQELDAAARLRDRGDWEGAACHIARHREILGNTASTATGAALAAEIEAWAAASREYAARRRAREESVAVADAALAAALKTASPAARATARTAQLRALANAIANAENLAATPEEPAPDATLAAAARARRDQLLEAGRRARRRTRAITAVVTAILVGAAGLALTLHRSARARDNAAGRLSTLVEEGNLLPAEAFENTLNPSWDKHPPFHEKHQEFQTWLAAARKRVNATLAAADAIAALTPQTLPHASLRAQQTNLEAWRKQTAALPQDTRAGAAARLDRAAARLEEIRLHHAARLAPEIAARIAALTASFAAAAAQPETAQRLASVDAAAFHAKFAEVAATVPANTHFLPPETIARWETLRAQITATRTLWKARADADAALAQADARTLDGHYATLREITNATPAAAPAFAAVLNAEDAVRDPAPRLLAPEPAALWRASRAIAPGGLFLPATQTPDEIAIATQIASRKTLENLYRYTLSHYVKGGDLRNVRTERVYTVGKVRVEKLPMGDGYESHQNAELYRPGGSTESVLHKYRYFSIRREGPEFHGEALAPESAALRQFNRFYDAPTGRIIESPLALIERLRSTPSVSPLLKGWLQQELFKITEGRPAEWGVLFSPAARAAEARLRQITQNTLAPDAWVEPARWSGRLAQLESFYGAQGYSWLDEASARLRVFQTMSAAGFVKIGHVTSDGKLSLAAGRTPAGWLVGVTPRGALLRLKAADLLASGGATALRPLRPPVPFAPHSPVLALEIPPAQAAASFPNTFPVPDGGWDAYIFQPLPQNAATDDNAPAAPAVSAASAPTAENAPETPATPAPIPAE